MYLQDMEKDYTRLLKKIDRLNAQVATLKKLELRHKKTRDLLKRKTHALGERIKELNCLYNISYLVEKYGISLEKILSGIVEIIPPAWQYPEITCARIDIEENTFATENFKITPWKQSSPITVKGKKAGMLEVYYLEERPESYEGPFLREERYLIDVIAKRIGEIIERKILEKQVLEVSEWEQRRIGQDLHDSLSQQLTGIALLCKGLQKKIASKTPEDMADIDEIVSLIDDAITKTKGLARGLYPVRLEAYGFITAVSELANNIERLFGISCRFEYSEPFLIHDNTMATHLYRIVQEAVNNAIRHGDATKIIISLTKEKDKAILMIKNNGRPFRRVAKDSQGMGISIMRYRAGMIGASLDIKKGASGGTIVTCTFKIKEKK
ncbi:MAG TPA: histidine kinase [Syntrophorhabdaceae bacterium]|nr:histidine kinase [Syntrophorhabdaceae bacterium]HOT41852.1 histidine kinase [Syntrophorhabdaceae bacterium]HPC67573.1 histidine kinase [Syntrophorhabdaceae bacterium]HPP42825.1 histidine kinase [Syntrophorhabdaceae bacterium]HQE80778.1 histidine kinase [Syntrophorhabdaceae bacterium]